jgi:hypothetical protein
LDCLNIRINSVSGSCYNSFQMITKSFILPPYDRSIIRLFLHHINTTRRHD